MQKILFLIVVITGYTNGCEHRVITNYTCEKDKYTILKIHNYLRSRIASGEPNDDMCELVKPGSQPKAQNMKRMFWDQGLAESALNWGKECKFEHDTKESRKHSKFKCVGQNIAIRRNSRDVGDSPDYENVFCSLFEENKDYHFGPYQQNQNKKFKTGHYTQMIDANTEYVGCAFIYFFDCVKKRYAKFYLCNYGLCGNNVGKPPYEEGDQNCSEFNMKNSRIKGLCTNKLERLSRESENSHQSSPETKYEENSSDKSKEGNISQKSQSPEKTSHDKTNEHTYSSKYNKRSSSNNKSKSKKKICKNENTKQNSGSQEVPNNVIYKFIMGYNDQT